MSLTTVVEVRVVDNAVVPMSPVGPGPWPLTAGGGLLGLCLGIACVSVRQRTKQTVASANEAEALLGMPMLGDIAYSREQQELERLIEAKVRLGIAAGFAAPGAARLEGPEPGQALEALDESYPDFIKHLLRQGLHDRYLLARSARIPWPWRACAACAPRAAFRLAKRGRWRGGRDRAPHRARARPSPPSTWRCCLPKPASVCC
ncbi:hypothetical protein ACU4GD_39740 [Cupriavidus basilensis]